MSIANRLASAAVALFGRSDSPVSTSNQSPAVGGGGGWVNWATGQGIMGRDPATSATFGFQMQLPDMLRDNLYYFEPLTGIVVDRPAKDLVRRGVEFKGCGGYDLGALESKLDDLQWLKNISRAYRWARKDGGSAMVLIVDDGREAWRPIDYKNLRRVHALQVLERRQISVAKWNYDPTTEGYNEPLLYYVHAAGARNSLALVHRDRVIRFVHGDLPYRASAMFQGWGVSVIDRIWGPLRAKGAALAAISTILTSYAVDVVKITGYAEAVKLGNRDVLQMRADQMRATLGNLGKIFIDSNGEDFTPLVRSAAGLADIIELLIDEAQAGTNIPKSILRGISPGGLGDGENAGEIRGYYDWISGEQDEHLIPPGTRIVDLTARSLIGPLQGRAPAHWRIVPKPLWQPTDLELAQIGLTNAQRRSTDWLSGNMSREEFRSDPTFVSLYDLEDDADGEEMDELELTAAKPFPPGHTPMTTREAAAEFGVGPGTIRSMIHSGKIGAYKMGRGYVVSLQEVMAAAKRIQALPADPTIPAESPEDPALAAA